ncbi:MAG: radical SAM protein [Nitrospiraceae bacterium]|nr:MAG: radical SAM protein [Nitrospiraceae bacterium]
MICQKRIFGAEFSKKEIQETAGSHGLLSMEIEFNRNCNFNCIYCYVQDDSHNRKELSREEARDVIVQARELGAQKLIVLGGEPMLYPHIMEMVGFVREQGMEIELFTNGANISEEVAKKLCDNGVVVVLKMNTADEKLQDMLSGRKGAYKNIHNALENLKKAGYPEKTQMGISTIICSQNFDELIDMWVWLRDQKINPYFEMITPQGNARENGMLEIDSLRVKELFEQISQIDSEKYGYNWKPQPPLVGGQCLRHQFSCAVNAYGDVLPCIGVTIPVGNIREAKLANILKDSEVIEGLRNYKKTIKGPCSKCESRDECYGCRGAAYQMTGDYLSSDPTCWKNADRQNEIVSLPVKTDRLVPHGEPMRVVDRLIEVKERQSLSEVEISDDSIFIGEDGKLNEVSYPEIFSQAIAAQDGFKNLGNGGPGIEGLLLGIKNLEILGSAGVGDKLHVSVYKTARLGGFGIIQGEIFKGEDLIARGEIKVWHKDKDTGAAAGITEKILQ